MYNAVYSVRVDTIERNIVKDWYCSLPNSPQKYRVLNGLGIENSRPGEPTNTGTGEEGANWNAKLFEPFSKPLKTGSELQKMKE